MALFVLGWVSSYLNNYPEVEFTEERKKALIERIRKREYNFTYEAHQTLPYAAPFYSDKKYCILTKPQWDAVMDEAYGDNPRGARKLPMDVITTSPKNDVLFEKKKFDTQGDTNDG